MPLMEFGALLSLLTRSAGRSFLSRAVVKKRFYRQLLTKADRRFDDHLARLKKGRNK